MDDNQLERRLQSVGKEWFVKYFRHLSDRSVSNENLIKLVIEENGYNERATASRVSGGHGILKSGRGRDALLLVANSKKIPDCVVDQARKLAEGLR